MHGAERKGCVCLHYPLSGFRESDKLGFLVTQLLLGFRFCDHRPGFLLTAQLTAFLFTQLL